MMTRSTIFISTIILAGILLPSIAGDNPCRYELPSKGVIDLTSVGNKDGTAAFLDVTPTPVSGWKYSYNPCKPFSESTFCQKVAACQVGSTESFPIGTQESAQWLPPSGLAGSPSIIYTAGLRTTNVTLKCSTNGSTLFEALGEGPPSNYRFRLTHQCACWDACSSPPPPPRQNCTINGSVDTSDKEFIQSLPFRVSINPSLPLPSPPNANYALVDKNGRVIELTLFNIQSIPLAVFCLSHLQILSIQYSIDLSIPPDILLLASSLTSLTVLSISNSLTLPPELFNMSSLSTLSIVNCGLETLSEDIIKLGQLTELTLDANQLITLPATLGKMLSLTSFSVNGNNRLSSLDVLSGSTSLITLRASNCAIDHIPTKISNLRTIEMNNNQLSSLDGIETIASLSIDSFSFNKNRITSISTTSLDQIQTLHYFDLSDNLLTTLPEPLYQIIDLQTLNIRNNKFDEKESEWIQGRFRPTNTTIIV